MGVDMKVKAIYDSEIGNITRSEKNWKDVLKVAGQLYRYEFDNIVMVTAQRPPEKSTLMADYDTWKKVGRYVKRGAKGCAIFPSRALNPRMRYIFDISDTGGKNVKLTWDLDGENLKDYVDFLVSEGQIEQYDNGDRETLKNILKQFTGTNVWIIIKNCNVKILRQIFKHITAARCAATVKKQTWDFLFFLCLIYKFLQFFLIISFIQCFFIPLF